MWARLVFLALAVATASASETATLTVVVNDSQGARIPNAKVNATDAAGNHFDLTANVHEWSFSQGNLALGKYTIVASAQSFKAQTREVKLHRGLNQVTFALEVNCGEDASPSGERPARLQSGIDAENLVLFAEYAGGMGFMGFTVAIFRDGTVRYKDVDAEAPITWKISSDEVRRLVTKLITVPIQQKVEDCTIVLDGPTRALSVNSNGKWLDLSDGDDSENTSLESGFRALMVASGVHEHRHPQHTLMGSAPWEDAKWFEKAGMDALMRAAALGNADRVKKLIAEGANVRAQDSSGFSALHLAAHANCFECVTLLRAAGAPIEDQDHAGTTALMVAALRRSSDESVLNYLLELKADPRRRDSRGQTAMHWAAAGCNLEAIQSLKAAGANKFEADSSGHTPLDIALALSSQGGDGLCDDVITFLRNPD